MERFRRGSASSALQDPGGAEKAAMTSGELRYGSIPNGSDLGDLDDASHEIRRIPRTASPHRRAPDAADAQRHQVRRPTRCAGLRRVLGRRAPLHRLGGDRVAGDVPGGRRRAHPPHPPGHRRRVAALPPPVQRRPADGPARPHERRPADLRHRPRRVAVRRLHAGDRSDDPARPPGRGDRRGCSPASASPTGATGSRSRMRVSSCSRCRRSCRWSPPPPSARRA
jgi:hypothetical protein